MFFITEKYAAEGSKVQRLSSDDKASASYKKYGRIKADYEKYNPNAKTEVERRKVLLEERRAARIAKLAYPFKEGSRNADIVYSTSMSSLKVHGSSKEYKFRIRDVAEATILGRSLQETSNQREIDNGKPLLDGLAVNLILDTFRRHEMREGIRELRPSGTKLPWAKSEPLTIKHFVNILNHRKHWLESRLATDSRSTMIFSVPSLNGAPLSRFKLKVTAEVQDGAIPTKLIKAESLETQIVENFSLGLRLTEIFKDQERREQMVEMYLKQQAKTPSTAVEDDF